ncbi:hypothetical protein AY599_08340 [Leptolyngbya valderiana BDU 20041]|nr:SET domain-containing protein-lysine N-methyltransferase [Geitlerinema sp. CS-897]OAB55183.1 hypothetical protein AY599_08340 [Leptolyngbya valderiana BDU 20041]PPT09329.1 protein containing SET domain [Geitlerinema sp. FC II]
MSLDTVFHVEIRPAGQKGLGVFATRDFQKGETVVVARCIGVLPERTIYSIQVDWDVHIEMDEPAIRINHSDNPNTGVRDNSFGAYDFVAIVDIAAGEEITFDYETTESDLTEEFQRCCPPRDGGKRLSRQGFSGLPAEVRSRYGEFVANYLKS